MKDKIIARLTYYRNVDEERSTNQHIPLIDKVVLGEKVKVWDQAIAIVREVMDE